MVDTGFEFKLICNQSPCMIFMLFLRISNTYTNGYDQMLYEVYFMLVRVPIVTISKICT